VSAFNGVADLFLAMFPIWIFYKVQLVLAKKIGILVILGAGILYAYSLTQTGGIFVLILRQCGGSDVCQMRPPQEPPRACRYYLFVVHSHRSYNR
jgi:hypothetical protein